MRPHLAALLLAASCACAGATYDDYRAYAAEHPGWEPAFPKDAIALRELLAVVHAPTGARHTTLQVTHVRVLGLGTDPWEPVPLESIRAGTFAPEPGRIYILVARSECLWRLQRTGGRADYRSFYGYPWYLLRDGRLLAYEHVAYADQCEPETTERGSVHQIPGFAERLREEIPSWRP